MSRLTCKQLEPYINTHNTVVMSENGARPKHYSGFQQTDVIRIKAYVSELRVVYANADLEA
jgi:hypothetical protein